MEVKSAFKDWMARRISDYDFTDGQDFCSFLSETNSGGRPAKEYHISLDMAKELSMVERNDKGKEARKYFIECESRARSTAIDYSSPAIMLGVIENLKLESERAKAKVIELAPKAAGFDQMLNADGVYGLQNAARALGARPNMFTSWLKQTFLFYQGGALVPRVKYTQMGLFEVKTTIIDDKARPRTYVTPKGLNYFRDRLPEHIKIGGAA